MRSKSKKSEFRGGFGLLEMVIYLAIMSLILIVVVNTLSVILLTQGDIKNFKRIEQSSIIALDRITREIRDAGSPDTTQSQFGSHPGKLVLNTTDDLGDPKVVEFSIDGDVLVIIEDGVPVGPLTNPQVKVTDLIFYHLIVGSAEAIRIELTLESGTGDRARMETFYVATTFRGI